MATENSQAVRGSSPPEPRRYQEDGYRHFSVCSRSGRPLEEQKFRFIHAMTQSQPTRTRWAYQVMFTSGALQTVLGAAVTAGWHLRYPALLQIRPGYIAMAYYTALCFIACGIAQWSLGQGRAGLARLAACFPIIIGALFIFEYGTEINLGIDQLIIQWEGPAPQRFPGRMAPASAVCFVLAGSALFLSASSAAERWRATMIGVAAAIIIALAGMAIVGYLTGISQSYIGGSFAGMALHTSSAMIVLGVGIFASEVIRSGEADFWLQRWLPFAAALSVAVPTLILCQALLSRQQTENIEGAETWLPVIVAIFGAVLSLAFALTLHFAQQARQHSKLLESRVAQRTTELAGVNHQLHASQSRLQATLLGGGIGTWYWDLDTKEVWWDESIAHLIGLEGPLSKDYRHAVFQAQVHPDDLPLLTAAMRGAPESGKDFSLDYRVLRRDGGYRWLAAKGRIDPGGVGQTRRMMGACVDITEVKVALEVRRQSEENFRFLAEAMPQIIWTATPAGILDYHNRRWFDYTGLTFEQTEERGWQSVIHPDEKELCLERWKQSFTTGANFETEYRFKRASDSSYRWHLGRAYPQRDTEGKIVRWVGTCTDIHDQKEAAFLLEAEILARTAELRRVSALSQGILESAGSMIASVSRTGRFKMWNRAAQKNLGWTEKEVMGHLRADILFSPLELEEAAAELTAELGTPIKAGAELLWAKADRGQLFEREWTLIRKDESRFQAMLSVAPLKDAATGKVTRIVVMGSDLSGQRDAEARLRKVSDRVPGIVFQARLSAQGEFTVPYASNAARTILGLSTEEIRSNGEAFFETVHSEDRARVRESLINSAAQLTSWQCDYRTQLSNGATNWLHGDGVPEKASDDSVLWYGVISDITERKQLELALANARDQALEGSRLKSEFLATMSHEIRTPMNGIIGMSGMLMETPLDPKQREMGRVIRRSADNLLKIINDILDFSKIEAGKMRMETGAFNLCEMLEETAVMLAPDAHQKKLELICDLDPEIDCDLVGDAGRIRQIITNLMGNAIKFTDRGEILVTARCLEKTALSMTLRVALKDTGIGISDNVKGRLFASFSQGDGSSTRRFGGTGLGLAISRQLIQLMGGELDCESKEGEGSVFWFKLTLPRVEAGDVSSAVAMLSGARVLVVDDSPSHCAVLVRQLTGMGAKPTASQDSNNVVKELRRAASAGEPYELVLVDDGMPQFDSLALAGAIRTDPQIGGTSLVLLMSPALDKSTAEFSAELVDATLDRPVREFQLRRLLLRLLGKSLPTPPIFPRKIRPLNTSGLSLFLVEDNISNQMVATMMLEHQGHRVQLASNGRDALAKLAHSNFDAVLMDCQMPELDGYEATRRIRAGEVPGLNPRIPIIALTAHAMPSDRAICLAAGMDDYISKPIEQGAIQAALSRCGLSECPELPIANRAAAVVNLVPVLDSVQLDQLRQLRKPGGRSVAEEVAALFMREMPIRMSAMAELIAGCRGPELARAAHTLAGSCASLGAKRMRELVAELESSANEQAWGRASDRFTALQRADSELRDELKRLELTS